ncbi:MAG: DUF3466 family protein, partial [bacterium]|nr:DUF3466 family protein [bacterium]
SGTCSINNNGQIVGGAPNSFGYTRACLYDSTGGGNNTDLGTLGGLSWSVAFSINDNGQIVGSAQNGFGYQHACLFDPTGNGANIDLGTLGGNSYAQSINDNGQIVGWADNSGMRACLFDPTGLSNNIDLNTLINPASGWILTQASEINNNGWIVGQGINPDGQTHAFLLVIPEPATIILLTLGGLVLRRKEKGNF